MHYLVCLNFTLPFSDSYSLNDYLLTEEIRNPDCIRNHKYWDLIKSQTPDIIKLDGNDTILLIDITVRSSEERAWKDKQSKYLTMQIAFQDCGYSCEIIPIVFDSAARVNQVDYVIDHLNSLKLNKVQDFKTYRTMIMTILDSSKEMEKNSRLRNPTEFNNWLKFGETIKDTDYMIDVTESDVKDILSRQEYDPFGGIEPSVILSDRRFNNLDIQPEDLKFLDECSERIFGNFLHEFKRDVEPILDMKDRVPSVVKEYDSAMREQSLNSKKFKGPKKCFIMPYCTDIIESRTTFSLVEELLTMLTDLNGTDHHSDLFRSLKSQLLSLKHEPDRRLDYDTFCGNLSGYSNHMDLDRSNTGCISIPMTRLQKAWHQSEGPGRKALLTHGHLSKDPGVAEQARQSALQAKEDKTSVLDWDTDLSELDEFLEDLSQSGEDQGCFKVDHSSDFEKFNIMDDMVNRTSGILSSHNSVKWCSFVQMISKEIARNATRKRKGSKYCVSLCSDRRYGIVLAPGFRITSSSRPIWFKIFSTTRIPPDYSHGLFPTIFDHGSIWSTSWRSIDIYQIESFIRVRDSHIMSLLSYCEATNPGDDDSKHLSNVIKDSDVSSVMAVILISHNRSTSSVIQSARYLALRMLSVHPDPRSLLFKDFNVPIRNKILLFLIRRLMNFILEMSEYKIRDLQNKLKTGFEKNTGDVVDLDVDQPDDLPRVFTKGPGQSYTGLLCEIYFCMLFNKNQDESSSAALSILDKIVTEEEKLYNQSLPMDFETGLLSDQECIDIASKGFKSHFFSAHAVCIGSKLQAIHEHNRKPKGSAVIEVIQDNKFVKTLDKYATFKASTIDIKDSIDLSKVDPFTCDDYYDDIDMGGTEEDIERIVAEFDLSPNEFNVLLKRFKGEQLNPNERYLNNGILQKINSKSKPLRGLANRTKCVVNIIDILHKYPNVVTNVDLIRERIRNMRADIQIFKKNQIGGVREIEILTMEMRILLEYVERVPTSISKYDEREMISAKQKKGEIIKSNLMRMLGESSGRPLLNLNSCRDMSKWSQAFMPIIFFYTVLPYKDVAYDYVLTNMIAQILMTNKRLELPSKLVELWLSNPDERHDSAPMQALKEKFLSQDRKAMDCTYLNKSGMGQGLEQTGSTFLHLCQLSFRDRLWSMVSQKLKDYCKEKNYNIDLWYRHFDAVSSDDKTTYKLFSPKFPDCLISLMLFRKIEAFSEALFCMQDSERKSVELVNLAEFNSEFTMRYNQYSPIIKFAHKSVLIPDTRSPLRAISQLFGSVRELRANGGSSFLCRIAHYLNKNFCEEIFHTRQGEINDPSYIFSCSRKHCPADLGVYPIFQPELMDMAGLEYHNYLIVVKSAASNSIQALVRYLYQSSEIYTATDHASVERDYLADVLPRRVHIEISVGMSASLVRARENCPVTKKQLELELDPSNGSISVLDLIGSSKSNHIAKLKSASLLYTLGAKDSFKNTNGALYYARIGAMSTGHCFFLRNAESDETDKGITRGSRFYELVHELKRKSQGYQDIESALKMLRHFSIYDKCLSASSVESFKKRRRGFRLLKSRKMRTYSKSVVLHRSLSDILHYKWGDNPEELHINEFERDWEILKRRLPYLKETEVDTLKAMNVKVSGVNLYKLLLELVKTSTEKNEYSKWLLLGPSSSDMVSTAFCMRYTNSFGGLIGDDIDYTVYATKRDDLADISAFRYSVNCLIMDMNLDESESKKNSIERFKSYVSGINPFEVRIIDRIANLGRSGYLEIQDMKRLLMCQMLLEESETEIQETLHKLNHSYIIWVIEQEKTASGWNGAFDVMVRSGRSTLRMKGRDDMRGLSFEYLTDKWDPFQFYSMLDTLVKIWFDKGLSMFSMEDIRSRCRQVVKPDNGLLLIKNSDSRVPELRKLDYSKELIPIHHALDWRSDDFFFDYRQVRFDIQQVIRLSTQTRKGRSVKFSGIYNGVIPIHQSELADIEKSHGAYPSKIIGILNKAGYQTNNRNMKDLEPEEINEIIQMSKKVVLADTGMLPELQELSRKYGISEDYIARDKLENAVEETALYDRLLEELSYDQASSDMFFNKEPLGEIEEDDFFSGISLEEAVNIISDNSDPFNLDLSQINIAFQDEAFMGAIEPSPKLRPKIKFNQPPVNWSVLGQLFEKCIMSQYMEDLLKDTNKRNWSSSMSSILAQKNAGSEIGNKIMMMMLKYCLENIRVMPVELRTKFFEGTLRYSDLKKFKPNVYNIDFISMEVLSDF